MTGKECSSAQSLIMGNNNNNIVEDGNEESEDSVDGDVIEIAAEVHMQVQVNAENRLSDDTIEVLDERDEEERMLLD